jgi:hypothetical protein
MLDFRRPRRRNRPPRGIAIDVGDIIAIAKSPVSQNS